MSTKSVESPAVLPDPLRERVCQNNGPARPKGEFVLYWMRVALRGHDNPALDVAIEVANTLGVPVFVYQGLSERHPHASDRLHTFVLESTRDAQEALAERGVGFALHVERPGHRGPMLKLLAERAALVVTEEMPVEPLRRWTASLGAVAPVWTVDASCVVPMTLTRNAPSRAHQFRKDTAKERAARVTTPWTPSKPTAAPFFPDLPFAPLDLRVASDAFIAELVAQCDIDHTIGPVPHTPGGTKAGRRRWETFRDTGLRHYARRRNDPLDPRGTSRMSAHLHFGCVSPFRMAREAAKLGGEGADKYLDELLVWREMAWHFCFRTPELDSLAALPGWSRATLEAHAKDRRETLYDRDTLSRGQTGDPLWDTAQRSLVLHGELHNNVRMTWGKAIVGWTASPEEALEVLVDLNHRFALDGRDPSSYGGLLWCLGLFDRPFEPARPVLGTVRPRETEAHARRLDVPRWRRAISRPPRGEALDVAVIGAGLAGLTCARALQAQGLRVTVFDKSRGPGGRMSTRRREGATFDHGAQYFTVRDPNFERHVRAWEGVGAVAPWHGSMVSLRPGSNPEPIDDGVVRYVGAPRMSALTRHLAADLDDLRLETRIGGLRRERLRWVLEDEGGAVLGTWSRVVVAVPSPQAVPLLQGSAPAFAAQAETAVLDPCWALMVSLPTGVPTGFDAARVQGSPLAWLARDGSKPGRGHGERWVAHASPEWSREHLELSKEAIAELLMGALADLIGPDLPPPTHMTAHRWRFAQVTQPLGEPCLYDRAMGLGVCGDWCQGPRVEAAWRSGAAVAGRILGHFARPMAEVKPGLLFGAASMR